MHVVLRAAALGLIGVLLVSCSESVNTLRVEIEGDRYRSDATEGGPCSISRVPDRVRITDGDGSVIGTSALEGRWVATLDRRGNASHICVFGGEVDAPRRDFYSVELGSQQPHSYSFDELVERDWLLRYVWR